LRVDILPWSSDAASHYARIRATLEGEPVGNLDLMIAAKLWPRKLSWSRTIACSEG
jgi:predicted nucleic acid-binding protein